MSVTNRLEALERAQGAIPARPCDRCAEWAQQGRFLILGPGEQPERTLLTCPHCGYHPAGLPRFIIRGLSDVGVQP